MAWGLHGVSPSAKKIGNNADSKGQANMITVRIVRDTDCHLWQVETVVNGKVDDWVTYYTDDLKDAKMTRYVILTTIDLCKEDLPKLA